MGPILRARKCLGRLTGVQMRGMFTIGFVALLFATVGVVRESRTALVVAALVTTAGVIANIILANLAWKTKGPNAPDDENFKMLTITLLNVASLIGLVVVMIMNDPEQFAWAFVFVASATILPAVYWISSTPIGNSIHSHLNSE